MSIAGGTHLAIERAVELSCNVLQLFVKNCNRWQGSELTEKEVKRFRTARGKAGLVRVVAHDSYLINLASPSAELWERSIQALIDESTRCERLGIDYLVAHPGAHLSSGETTGILRIGEAINRIHQEIGSFKVRLALETTAGQGTSLGYRFEHLRDILASLQDSQRVAVCLDTCHIFAAGYDIRSAEDSRRTMSQFEQAIGLDKLAIIHVNDSKRPLGSRVDRHEHLGRGRIGKAGFKAFLHESCLADRPLILETPKGKGNLFDKQNLKTLRGLLSATDKET
jgi:deoxyribonuclease-4